MERVIHGDALEVLKSLPDESVDSVVTDPPYGIAMMHAKWDTFSTNKDYAAWVETWAQECLRVLKPGGHLLAFSSTRTYHALAWGIESAGFSIRDMLEWVYASGMPKSLDVGKQFDKRAGAKREVVGFRHRNVKPFNDGIGWNQNNTTGDYAYTAPATDLAKQWDGWGTSLKPSHEPIVMARKPFVGTVADNVEKYGTGAINIDACRIPFQDEADLKETTQKNRHADFNSNGGVRVPTHGIYHGDNRPPVNYDPSKGRFPANSITTEDGVWYSKFFNVSPQEVSKKATKKDRDSDWQGNPIEGGNPHISVKPVDLMAWMIRLVTPPGGLVLDPFAGSGSTLVAAKREGQFSFIGIERYESYTDVISRRTGCVVEEA